MKFFSKKADEEEEACPGAGKMSTHTAPCRTSSSTIASAEENPERGNWGGQLEFILSCLSYAVGLGNLWRFPYLCYRNGGGAFLIPYAVMLVFTGIPMFFLELSFGQFASEGVISIWKISPIMKGIGWGMFIVSSFIAVYYNMIIAWTLFYLVASLTNKLPWTDCTNHWNSDACGIIEASHIHNCTDNNGTWYNHTCHTLDSAGPDMLSRYKNLTSGMSIKDHMDTRQSPSDEYFHNYVLDISDGFHEMGGVRWELALSLLGAWVLVGLCLIKGIKSQGKAVYFTATFPYLVLTVLLVRGMTLKGSLDGVLFYLIPDWNKLLTAKVWGDAAVQIFFSLSPCWGGLITLASYNKFHNNCLRDAILVSVANCATSFFSGFVVFGILGFMANEMGLKVGEVAKQGAGLAFILYPEVVSRLPISPLWAVLFFLMLVTLGLGTQFSVVVTVHTTLLDSFPDTLRRGKRPMLVLIGVCTIGYLLGLSCCTRGGMYMVQLIDNYAATYSLLIIGLFECVAINYIYGTNNFFKDIEMMLGHRPSIWWRIMWRYVTPALLFGIMIFTWVDYEPSRYGEYKFPLWADTVGWCITMTSVAAIPVAAVVTVLQHGKRDGSWLNTIRFLAKPAADWGPAIDKHRSIAHTHDSHIPLNMTPRNTSPNCTAKSDHTITVDINAADVTAAESKQPLTGDNALSDTTLAV